LVYENVCMITGLLTKLFQRYQSGKTFIRVLPTIRVLPARWRRKSAGTEIASLSPYVCIEQASFASAGLMPTEARGNYLPEPHYLRESKTYHSQPLESIPSDTTCWQLFRPAINTAHFYFLLLQKLCQITWLLTGWKNFLHFRRPPEACGICHVCHMVNRALSPAHTMKLTSLSTPWWNGE